MEKYTGKIVIIGKPNVGKSSLLNTILQQKVSITNAKPQTTRNHINAIYDTNKYNIQFFDTPGFHKTSNKLDEFLNQEVQQTLKKGNLIFFLLDRTRKIDDEDYDLISVAKKLNIPKILVVTKDDAPSVISNLDIELVSMQLDAKRVVHISISNLDSVETLLLLSQPFLQTNAEQSITKQDTIKNDIFLIKEIIREQCLTLLHQEIPYGVAIVIDNFKYDANKNLTYIDASIVVEKEGHKKIVIGKNGIQIKEIGEKSRTEILKIFDSKIMLKLFVKVDKNWRNNETKLKEFGYSV